MLGQKKRFLWNLTRNNMPQNSVKALTLSTLNTSTLTDNYQAINTGGFAYPIFYLRIVNDSSNPITISFDGINDHEYIVENTSFELGSQTNAQPLAQVALFAARGVVYVKGTPSSGTVTVSGYYV